MTDKQMEEFRPTISEHYDFNTIIENHRKLWRWIAVQMKEGNLFLLRTMKKQYFVFYNVPCEKWPMEDSWLCHWVKTIFYSSDDSCDLCPLSIGNCFQKDPGLYYRFLNYATIGYVITIVKKIADAEVKDTDLSYSPWPILGYNETTSSSIRDLMKLSQEQFVELHRRLWMWKSKEIFKRRREVSNHEYFEYYHACLIEPNSDCWLCHFRNLQGSVNCRDYCLKSWGLGNGTCFSLLSDLEESYHRSDWDFASALCEEIANLPTKWINRKE